MAPDALYSHIHYAVAHDKAPASTPIGVCQLFVNSPELAVVNWRS